MNGNELNILFTGLTEKGSEINSLAEYKDVRLIKFPTIEIMPLPLSREDLNIINYAADYDFLVFTSVNAVKYFFSSFNGELTTLNRKTKIVAIGKKTAEKLMRNNIDVDLIPSASSSESIDVLLSKNLVDGKSVLIPGSKISKADLFQALVNKGAAVDFVAVYDNQLPGKVPEDIKEKTDSNFFNLFVFTSPSTFNNFIKLFEIGNPRSYFADKDIAVIGPVTERAITERNIKVAIKPDKFNLTALKNEIINFYGLDK